MSTGWGLVVLVDDAEPGAADAVGVLQRIDQPAKAAAPRPPALPDGDAFPALPRRWIDEAGSAEMKAWPEDFADASATGEGDDALRLFQGDQPARGTAIDLVSR